MKDLEGPYQLDTVQIDISGASFQSIIKHAKLIKSITQATQGGTKKVLYRGEFSGCASRSSDFFSRGSYGYQGS